MNDITKTQTVVEKLDEEIKKLAQVRELLADAGVLAVVKQVINRMEVFDDSQSGSCSPEEKRLRHGGVLNATYQCVRLLNEPFTKVELATKMRSIGCVVDQPKTQLQYAMQKLLSEGVVRIVEGGGGRHPTRYQTNANDRPTHQSDANATPIASADSRFRDALNRTAFRCVQGMSGPFTTNDLAQSMRTAGYTFVGDAGLSAQGAVAKFLDAGLLEIVNPGNGQQPVLYGRRSR